MKKKIGDLTIREVKEIEDKICGVSVGRDGNCADCPFAECCVNNYCDLEREIEVEENENIQR